MVLCIVEQAFNHIMSNYQIWCAHIFVVFSSSFEEVIHIDTTLIMTIFLKNYGGELGLIWNRTVFAELGGKEPYDHSE